MPSTDFLLGSQWIHEESLQFPTIVENNGKLVVSIQEFQPNSTPPLSLIRSFLIPPHDGKFSFPQFYFMHHLLLEQRLLFSMFKT